MLRFLDENQKSAFSFSVICVALSDNVSGLSESGLSPALTGPVSFPKSGLSHACFLFLISNQLFEVCVMEGFMIFYIWPISTLVYLNRVKLISRPRSGTGIKVILATESSLLPAFISFLLIHAPA